MVFHFHDFIDCLLSGIKYIPATLYAVFLTLIAGILVGTLFAMLRLSKATVLSKLIGAIFTLMRCLPPVLTFTIVYLVYKLKFADVVAFLHLSISIRQVDVIYPGMFALFLVTLPIISDGIRSAVMTVTTEQYEAGYSIGLTCFQVFMRIVVPQTIPVYVPVLINNFIILLKTSSLFFVIGVMDIYNGSLLPSHITYGYLEGYVAAGVIYYGIFFVVERCGAVLEKRLSLEKTAIKGTEQ